MAALRNSVNLTLPDAESRPRGRTVALLTFVYG